MSALRARGCFPYVDEVFVSAADDVVVGDGDGVDAAPAGLQDVNTLQRADVPDLINTQSRRGVGGGGRRLGGFCWTCCSAMREKKSCLRAERFHHHSNTLQNPDYCDVVCDGAALQSEQECSQEAYGSLQSSALCLSD